MKKITKILAISMLFIALFNIKVYADSWTIPVDDGKEEIGKGGGGGGAGGGSKKPVYVYLNDYDHPDPIYIDSDFNTRSVRGEWEEETYNKDGDPIITVYYYIKHYLTRTWDTYYDTRVSVEHREMDVAYKLDITGPEGSSTLDTYSRTQQAFSPVNGDGIGGNPRGSAIANANRFRVMDGNPAQGKYIGMGYGYRHYYDITRTDNYRVHHKRYTNGVERTSTFLNRRGANVTSNVYNWEKRFERWYVVTGPGPNPPIEEVIEDNKPIDMNEVIIY